MTERPHVQPVSSIEQDRLGLVRLIEEGQASEAEVSYLEAFADPDTRALNKEQRRRAGQYLRRVRRRDREARKSPTP